jgi:hypothetical protein
MNKREYSSGLMVKQALQDKLIEYKHHIRAGRSHAAIHHRTIHLFKFGSTKCVNSFGNGPLIRSSHSAKRAVSNLNRCAQPCSRTPFCFLQRKLKNEVLSKKRLTFSQFAALHSGDAHLSG